MNVIVQEFFHVKANVKHKLCLMYVNRSHHKKKRVGLKLLCGSKRVLPILHLSPCCAFLWPLENFYERDFRFHKFGFTYRRPPIAGLSKRIAKPDGQDVMPD